MLAIPVRIGLIVLLGVIAVIIAVHVVRGSSRTNVVNLLLHFLGKLALALLVTVLYLYHPNTSSQNNCSGQGLVLNYLLLAHATWILIISYNVHQTAVPKQQKNKHSSSFAWQLMIDCGLPLIIGHLFMIIHTPSHSNHFYETYGTMTVRKEFCLFPETNLGGFLGTMTVPILWLCLHPCMSLLAASVIQPALLEACGS